MTVTIDRYDLRPHVNVWDFLDQIQSLQHLYKTRGRYLPRSYADRVPDAIAQWIDNPSIVNTLSDAIVNRERLNVHFAA